MVESLRISWDDLRITLTLARMQTMTAAADALQVHQTTVDATRQGGTGQAGADLLGDEQNRRPRRYRQRLAVRKAYANLGH